MTVDAAHAPNAAGDEPTADVGAPADAADAGQGEAAEAGSIPVPLIRLDAGWFFLLAGLGLIAATVLIPARHDLAIAEWQRDRALAIEKHRMDRLERYGKYIAAFDQGDESVLLSLAATQLNKSPVDRVPLTPVKNPAQTSASVFPELEPGPVSIPPKPVITDKSSLLTRWTTNNATRVWLLAGGVLCVMIGLLPPSVRKRR
jgi:hypothetical protein